MKRIKYFVLLLFVLCSQTKVKAHAKDSLSIIAIESRVNKLEEDTKEIRRDELNYKVEKDLLKETYQNNYERISLIITIVLGIIGVLGFLGIRDINSIKKEYATELSKLKSLQSDISSKFTEFQNTKEKYDTELKDILSANEEQNKKIKVLELKEKISSLFKEERYGSALEFCTVALEISPQDIGLLINRARIHTRLRNYPEAIITYNKVLELDKNNNSAILDLTEVYLFNNQRIEYKKMIKEHNAIITEKLKGKLVEFFEIITLYQDKNLARLRELAASNIDLSDLESKRTRVQGWEFADANIYLLGEIDSDQKTICQAFFWYLSGLITGNDFFRITKIDPKA